MADEKPHRYEYQQSLPIPTYEEATSSRPSSAQSHTGPEEISDDAERQGLLSNNADVHDLEAATVRSRAGGYQNPTVDSARSSLDLLGESENGSARSSAESLQREFEQMDMQETGGERDALHRSQLGQSISKRFSSISHTLSAFNLPFRRYLPSFSGRLFRLDTEALVGAPAWSIALRFVGMIIVVSVVYILFISDVFGVRGRNRMGQIAYNPESVRLFAQSHTNATNIREYLKYITSFDHIAGTEGNFILGKWVEEQFVDAMLDEVGMEEYQVYLNYPREGGRRVAIVDPPEMAWEATIEEEQAYTDPPRQQTLVFHGNSKAGNVTGPLIYANYGSREDFALLAKKGIDVNGSIALVRYYGTQGDRALKVKAAELAGAVGCIIYSDPAEDGFVKGAVWPEGRFRPEDGVQRGAVSLMSFIVGDVLSPGFASTPSEEKRIDPSESAGMNKIPSIPLAWRDAQKLLQSLKGHGMSVPQEWVGGVPEVDWFTGDQSSPKVNLANEQDEEIRQPIFNVLGRITGIEQAKSIIVGNHRDAWCYGAVDPGSGTAVMLEVVRIFGELRSRGWRPLRTIEFASWDAEEYNLVGSTEHVEQHVEELRRDGFAYINVDVGVLGDDFTASASPLMEKALLRVLDRTVDPVRNRTMRDIWNEKGSKLGGLGAGSDYVAFQDIAGTSSIDMSFRGEMYPYHSCYDNFDWMEQVGDPDFKYHEVMAQIWVLLILELADRPVLPFDMEAYARAVKGYVNDLLQYSQSTVKGLDFTPLENAADTFMRNAMVFHRWDDEWSYIVDSTGGFESNVMAIKRMSHNARMANFETHLLDLEEGGGVSDP